jgi:hypothetical protein
MKNLLLFLFVALVYVAHQDLCNWHDASLMFGFLPVGLAYHAAYSIATAVMMAVLVRFAWPKGLDQHETASPKPPQPHS